MTMVEGRLPLVIASSEESLVLILAGLFLRASNRAREMCTISPGDYSVWVGTMDVYRL